MNIAFFGISDLDKLDFYKEHLAGHTVAFYEGCLDSNTLPPDKDQIEILSIFVHCKAPKALLEQLPNLKLITVRSTGYDNVDLEYAKSKNIFVSTVPAYGIHTVAEFTFGLLLALLRNIPQAIEKTQNQKFDIEGLRGTELFNKTIGIIGTGKIGAEVTKIAKGFGLKILAFDLYPNQNLKESVGFDYISLEELLKQSDFVTIHTPATEQTKHLLNEEKLSLMKQTAVLINTARGSIIDTPALLQSLQNHEIAGAAIDVLEDEGSFSATETELSKLPNVIITPHIAFYTKEAEDNIMQTTVDNIDGFIKKAPINLVNK